MLQEQLRQERVRNIHEQCQCNICGMPLLTGDTILVGVDSDAVCCSRQCHQQRELRNAQIQATASAAY